MNKLLTRNDIIDSWKNLPEHIKDKYCCPFCICTLKKTEYGRFTCPNDRCTMSDEELNNNYEVK